jgi:PilZ domain-containing protein
MFERRQALRRRTLKGGSILYGLAPAIECTIRNMSDRGASVEVKGTKGIPDEFELLIKPELLKRKCHVMWRSEDRLGVQFL